MSGRSAYVRKKITETKTSERGQSSRAGPRSPPTGPRSPTFGDFDYPAGPPGTGYGTTNARLLRFSEQARDAEVGNNYGEQGRNMSIYSSGSQSGGSESGRRDGGTSYHQGPMPEFAYARVRKPTIKTEDISGIEKSGFRSAIDKKSDDVRKGLSKAFSFGKKSKRAADQEAPPTLSFADSYAPDRPDTYDYADLSPPQSRIPRPSYGNPWDNDHDLPLPPPPSSKLPAIPPPITLPAIRRWIGAGRPVQRWNKLRKDPELWDPNGDVLVFLGQRGQASKLNPSFRLSSHIIEATESRSLITLLREGSTEEDIHLPPSPAGAPPMLSRHGSQARAGYAGSRGGQPTPPMSDDNSQAEMDGQISYEMYFPTPPELTRLEAHRYAITTRNIFAVLYHASLVGISLYQALSDLHARLELYMPPEADNVGTILNYLSARGIDDARNDPEAATSLLAWSETPEVRWEEGWREAFLHAAGMYTSLETCADFKKVTPITRALLERACLETQLRVQAAEERLADFTFPDIWPPAGPVAIGAARAAADRLQKFLTAHYANAYDAWPPSTSAARTPDGKEMWLTRTVAQKLQKDFGALYDYLVNRDIIWDESETRSSRKWMMVSESGNMAFDADTANLPFTDMLIEFDNRYRFPHIPHPYPLVPESIPQASTTATSARDKKKSEKEKGKTGGDDRVLERRVQLAYTEATNIYVLGSDFTQSDLVDRFVKFEKSDHTCAVDPSAARRGRWVLIYAILQTLASVSVDSPNIRYKEEVAYHLSPRLKGTKTPPWKGVRTPALEATHELSYCWLTPRSWNNTSSEAEESDDAYPGGDPSPVMKMMRAHQGKIHNFSHPPQSVAGSITRSVQSGSMGGGTIWGGSSAMSSVSDETVVSGNFRLSVLHHQRGPNILPRNQNTVGRAEERGRMGSHQQAQEWPTKSQSIRRTRDTMATSKPLPSLNIHADEPANGGFLNLEDSPPQTKRSTSRLRGGGVVYAEGPGMVPVIRDFDDLAISRGHAS